MSIDIYPSSGSLRPSMDDLEMYPYGKPKGYRAAASVPSTAPTYVQSAATNGGGTTAARPTFASAVTPGNTLVAMITFYQANVSSIIPAADWELVGFHDQAVDGGHDAAVLVNFNTSSSTTQPAACCTWTGSSNHVVTLAEASNAASIGPYLQQGGTTSDLVLDTAVGMPEKSLVLVQAGMAYSVDGNYYAQPFGSKESSGSYNSASASYPTVELYQTTVTNECDTFTFALFLSGTGDRTGQLLTLLGPTSGNTDVAWFTVPSDKRFIVKSITAINMGRSAATVLVYINDISQPLVPTWAVAEGTTAVQTGYLVLEPEDEIFWTMGTGMSLSIDGVEI